MFTVFRLTEVTDGGLNVFVGLKANISSLEGPGCWSSTTMKDAGCDDADADHCGCCTLATTVAGCDAPI